MYERKSTRPIKLATFVRRNVQTIWANVEEQGRVGCQLEFLAWLNGQLRKGGKDTINLETCVRCKNDYWTLGKPGKRYVCDACE